VATHSRTSAGRMSIIPELGEVGTIYRFKE
jgi:hypothetical protein